MAVSIGSLHLPHGLMLAPMAGFTDHAMRVVCREAGAEYAVTEMVSAKAVCYGDKKTASLARIRADEPPTALQLFGSDPACMAEAAAAVSGGTAGGVAPVAIDINMGCPVPKVAGNGEGSALMRDPAKILAIVTAVRAAVSLPVTVKIRTGWDFAHINAVECALAAEEGGASLVTVHGRTRTQMYSGEADLSVIARVKQAVRIPVVGNGDVTDGASALRMLSETGCDGLMIGRGAVGNPFVFGEILCALRGEDYTPPALEEILRVALRQLTLAAEEKGETVAVRESRKQISRYLRGFPGASAARQRINTALTVREVEQALRDGGERKS